MTKSKTEVPAPPTQKLQIAEKEIKGEISFLKKDGNAVYLRMGVKEPGNPIMSNERLVIDPSFLTELDPEFQTVVGEYTIKLKVVPK